MAEVIIKNLNKSYGPVAVLRDVSLTVEDGSFVVLVGPSGCGKSTLLRSIAGLEQVDGGSMTIGNRKVNDLAPAKREIAMVFQSYALYPHMNVERNMAFGLKFARTPKPEIERRVAEAARILKLEPLLKRRPRELSGGQRQRVAIGRAIVRKPQVFLFDEPLSNLDAALRINTRVEIAKLHKLLKATIIYVTHDQVEAMTLADKIVVMNQGMIEQTGKPLDLYYNPTNLFVAGFIGSPAMNFMGARIVSKNKIELADGSQLSVSLSASCKIADTITLGVRPEHMKLEKPGKGDLEGTLDLVERLGETGFAHVRLDDGTNIVVEVRGHTPDATGNRIGMSMNREHLHLFDSDGRAMSNTP